MTDRYAPQAAAGRIAAFVALAFFIHWTWEAVHAAAYVETVGPLSRRLLHCLPMAGVDAVWSLALLATARTVLRATRQRTHAGSFWLMATLGATSAAALEWYALETGRWTYNAHMPVIPGLRLGLSPVLQMAVVPVAAAWASGACSRHGSQRR